MISSLDCLLKLQEDYNNLPRFNSAVKEAFDLFRITYRKLSPKFPKLKIRMFYAAMKADSYIHENLECKRNEIVNSVQKNFTEALIDFSFLGAEKLLDLARKQPNQTFELEFTKSVPSGNAYVILCSLKEYNLFLRDGGNSLRYDLFDANVRDFQGTTKVNSAISQTLKEKNSVDFWWLNNGVTILASKASQAGSAVTLENPQIVNGLQTSFQIANYFNDEGDRDDDRMVLVKIISSEVEEDRDQIIKATNSQNVVPRASLRATDKVQWDIEHTLKQGGYFYDRRKNYYKNQGRPAAKIVSISLLAQAMMSLLLARPNDARARPTSLINKKLDYDRLFNKKNPVDCYLVAADLIKRVEIALKATATSDAAERNNLRFYCLFWVAAWAAKSTSLTASKIVKLKDNVTDDDIEQAIENVRSAFRKDGGTDKIAKGSKFKDNIIMSLEKKIKRRKSGAG